MPVSDEDFRTLLQRVNALQQQVTGDQDQAAALEAAQQTAQQASELRGLLRQIGHKVFGISEILASETTPEGQAPANPANPFARPAGVQNLNAAFPITNTPYGQAWGQSLGVRSGYYAELVGWVPIVSALWDSTACLFELLGASDTPDSVVLTVGGRALELKNTLDAALRRIHIHELRAERNGQVADAYAVHLGLQARTSTYLPSDVAEWDATIGRKLTEKALKLEDRVKSNKWKKKKDATPKKDH